MDSTLTEPPPLLLWCDFETDGLDIAKLEILEACFVLTDTNLVELDRYTSLVRPSASLGQVIHAMDTVVHDMHQRSGLLDDLYVAAVKGGWIRKRDLHWPVWSMIDRAIDGDWTDQKVVLAGAGVAGFDRHVIRQWLPQLDQVLTYWCIDTSAVDRFANLFAGIDRQSGDAAHRAEADVNHALGVAKVWRQRMDVVADDIAEYDPEVEADVDRIEAALAVMTYGDLPILEGP